MMVQLLYILHNIFSDIKGNTKFYKFFSDTTPQHTNFVSNYYHIKPPSFFQNENQTNTKWIPKLNNNKLFFD